MEKLEIREFISIDTVLRDSYDRYVHLLYCMMKNIFKNERGYRDIKTEKALEQD